MSEKEVILHKGDTLKGLGEILAQMWKGSEKPIVVRLAFQRKTRTTGECSQNHHLNGHIQQICEDTGNDFGEIKQYVKMQALKRGYPVKEKDGVQLLSIFGDPIPISESDCSTVECGYLIDEVHILASELGIVLKEEE